MARQILRIEQVHARRVNADENDALPVKFIHQLRTQGSEIGVEPVRIGELPFQAKAAIDRTALSAFRLPTGKPAGEEPANRTVSTPPNSAR